MLPEIVQYSPLSGDLASPVVSAAAAPPSAVLARPVADDEAIALARRIEKLCAIDAEACSRFADMELVPDASPERQARADRLARRTSDAVERAVTALSPMQPQSLAGVMAKARAFQAVQQSGWEHNICEWRDDLGASIAADVLRVGGQANV